MLNEAQVNANAFKIQNAVSSAGLNDADIIMPGSWQSMHATYMHPQVIA